MNPQFQKAILRAAGASRLAGEEKIQTLWGGYGRLLRIRLQGGKRDSVVVKHVSFPGRAKDSDRSHQRKAKSYRVETAWYTRWSRPCDDSCRVPQCLAVERSGDEVLIVLEDLDAAGFGGRRQQVTQEELATGLCWLAHFHATFMGETPDKLWKTGTYWHLSTRPDELARLDDAALKQAAPAIDRALKSSPFQTFVHGDAKLANFCFSDDGKQVAAVDFQYVGGGCGMKDVAYYLGSCLHEDDCERLEGPLLDLYFDTLKKALQQKKPAVDGLEVEHDWRALYPVAWADFHRFMKGWYPERWDSNSYSERVTRKVIQSLSS